MEHFSPTQQRIVDLLADCLPHSNDEIYGCLLSAGTVNHIKQHLSNIRKILRPTGKDIATLKHNGRTHYCLIRLTNSH